MYGNDIIAFRKPAMRPRYLKPFADLNYFSRREALLASYCGHAYPALAGSGSGSSAKKETTMHLTRKRKGRHLPQNNSMKKKKLREAAITANKVNGEILPHNFLARLRKGGYVDCTVYS